ncbi:hypothetical protein ACFX2H_009136 [Malus domestica]
MNITVLHSRFDSFSIKADARINISMYHAAIATVVIIAEILKNDRFAVDKKVITSVVDIKDDSSERPIQRAKLRYGVLDMPI